MILLYIFKESYSTNSSGIKINVSHSDSENDDADEKFDVYTEQMNAMRDGIFQEAKENIKAAQQRMKRDYDKKNSRVKVI